MSDTEEEISTKPGVVLVRPDGSPASPTTSSPWLAVFLGLPSFVRPLTAWALLVFAARNLLPRLWESIQLADRNSSESAWKWTGAFIYFALTALCINRKIFQDAAGVAGAVTNFVSAVRGVLSAKKG